MLLDLRESGFATWIDKIYDILCVCELENVFYSEYFSTSDIYRITSLVRTSLQHQYVDKWKDEIQTKPKLRTYKLFKTTFFIEPYLYLYNKQHRQALARFRMSAHSLEIEKGRWHRVLINGRWQSQKTPIDERYCIFCSENTVESEIHVLMSCKRYDTLRQTVFSLARTLIDNFDALEKESKFVQLLETDNIKLLQSIAKFVYSIFQIRVTHENDNVIVNQ